MRDLWRDREIDPRSLRGGPRSDSLPSCPLGDHFAQVPDTRMDRARRHELGDIITIALGGVICGSDSWVEI